jgi:hypothetical protein
MVRRSLREEGTSSWSSFHGHGRPWSLGGAIFRGEGRRRVCGSEERSGKWKEMRQRRREWPAKLFK